MNMSNEFKNRMYHTLKHQGVSGYFKDRTNVLVDTTFAQDPNYKKGFIYDWDMNPIEELEFKIQKIKEHAPEKKKTEYYIQFRPYVTPETMYNDLFYRQDGKQRLGQYIDINNFETDQDEKWLIVDKESKTNLSKYYVFKCNWCLEWVSDGQYFQQVGVWRDSMDNNINNPDYQKLGGSELDGNGSFILPVNPSTRTIKPGHRVMITDSEVLPAVYEVQAIKDTEPLGVMKLYLKRVLINRHTDLWGNINDMNPDAMLIHLPLPSLPEGYGGDYHWLCNCKKSTIDVNPVVPDASVVDFTVSSPTLRVNGSPVRFELNGVPENYVAEFRIYVDNVEYSVEDLKDYFDIEIGERALTIKAINKVMAKYIVKVTADITDARIFSAETEVIL